VDFAPAPEQVELRRELRAFLVEPAVQEEIARMRECPRGTEPDPTAIYRRLGERRWFAVNWPEEYGGQGRSLYDAAVVSEELHWHDVPDTMHTVTADIVGLFLLLAADPDQKRRFLLPMARGELLVSVLYTEPEAGSDLSSLRTKAFRSGGGYLLYGTKVFSLRSHSSHYGLCAARTTEGPNPQHGITLFLVPLDAEGVTIRPLWSIADERFDEVVLDGVRVGEDAVVGPVDRGWQLMSGALQLERTGVEQSFKARRWLDLVIRRAQETGRLTDPTIGAAIAELDAEVEAGRILAWSVLSRITHNQLDAAAAAMSKWYSSELVRRIAALAVELDGVTAMLSRWDPDAPLHGFAESLYRDAPGMTISAGSSEVMLHIVASAGLGIPEEVTSRTSG
jgi:alkylation response protein AidB-like acyl-CoA dehydrogenase